MVLTRNHQRVIIPNRMKINYLWDCTGPHSDLRPQFYCTIAYLEVCWTAE